MSANIYRSSYYQSKNEHFNTVNSYNNVLVSRDSELFSSPENVMAVASVASTQPGRIVAQFILPWDIWSLCVCMCVFMLFELFYTPPIHTCAHTQ